MSNDYRPVNQRTGEIKDTPLVDDLAEVLSSVVVGWKEQFCVDLSQHPEVQRVMARYRSDHEHLQQLVLWGGEVDTDCTLFGNSLHSRIDGVIQRTDPATWMIRVVEPESEIPDWRSAAELLKSALDSFMAYDGMGQGGADDGNRGDWQGAHRALIAYEQARGEL